jgi:hypothetical protein
MSNRSVSVLLVLLGAANASAMHKQHRLVASLVAEQRRTLQTESETQRDLQASSIVTVAPLPSLSISPTFVEIHTARVENDLVLFQPTLVGITPSVRPSDNPLLRGPPVQEKLRFFAPTKAEDELAVLRDRDKLLLFRGPQPQGAAVGIGVAMFGAATLLSAHAPRALRVLFDGPVHLGPAVFDGGGMGAGIGARGL